jgi:hypothetical protein
VYRAGAGILLSARSLSRIACRYAVTAPLLYCIAITAASALYVKGRKELTAGGGGAWVAAAGRACALKYSGGAAIGRADSGNLLCSLDDGGAGAPWRWAAVASWLAP